MSLEPHSKQRSVLYLPLGALAILQIVAILYIPGFLFSNILK